MKNDLWIRMLVCCVSCVVVFSLYEDDAQATQAEFKMMRKLESEEKQLHPGQLLERPKHRYTAGNQRDPFESLIKKDEKEGTVTVSQEVEIPPPELTVQGVIWGGTFPQAIINDTLVKIGDELQGDVLITGIDAAGVTFEFNEKEYSVPAPAVRDSAQSE